MPKRTKKQMTYQGTPCGCTFVIPAHTPVIPASNLPQDDVYWAQPWEKNMEEEADGWMRNYGFLIYDDEVEDAPDDAEQAFLGDFDFVNEGDPVEISEYAIRLISIDEAEDMISDSSTGFNSYLFPSEVETVEV